MVGAGRDDRPGLDGDGRRDDLVGRQEPASAERPARDRDPDRGVAVRTVEPVGGEQRRDPGGQPVRRCPSGSGMSRPAAERRSRAMCSASSVGRPPRTRSVSKIPSPSWKPRSKTDRCAPSAGRRRPSTQTCPGGRPRRRPDGIAHPTSTAPIASSGPRALVDRLVPLGGRVALPGDPAADVEGQAPPVGHERADHDARLHRAVGPDPADGAGVRAAADRLEPLEDLHRPDLRGAGDRAARERRREEVERVAALGEDAGHGRDEVLDGGRPLEPAQARDADAPRPADAPEVVAQDVDDHHVLGAVLGARQQLARERAIGRGVAAARAGALDRVGRHDALAVDRQERLGRRRQERPRPAAQRSRPEIEIRREERRVAGPQAPVQLPRIAVERRLEPPGQVRLVDVAVGDVLADPLDAGLVGRPGRGPSGRRAARPRRAGSDGRGRASVSRAWTSSSRRARRRPSPSSARPPIQAWPVRRSQATTQSWSASRSGGRSWSAGAIAGSRSKIAPRS